MELDGAAEKKQTETLYIYIVSMVSTSWMYVSYRA